MGRSTPIFVACAIACTALLAFAARSVAEETTSTLLFHPKDGEVVAIKSVHTGKYFEVSPTDGKLYATAAKPVNKTALFHVMILSRSMVEILADAMRTTNVASWSHRKTTTKSNCKCSGYSAPPPHATAPDPSRALPSKLIGSLGARRDRQ